MFKRRKPDEPAQDPGVFGAVEPAGAPESPVPAGPGTNNFAAGPQDSGLGVPPFRPAFSPAPTLTKEPASMARAPFTTNPAPSPQPAQAVPVGNRQSFAPSSPGQGQGVARVPSPPSAERRTLVVGRGISLQGVVQDAERLVVEGTVEATMIHAAELAIAPGGVFKGEVEIEDAEIAGTIDGTLTARGNLVVRSTGKVLGTARCRRLQVEDGGQITGRIEMLTEARGDAREAVVAG